MQHIDGGMFITFEGPEGSGKSTQITRVSDVLKSRGYNVLQLREPGGTPLGEALRRLLLGVDGPDPVAPEAELLMFGASRAQLMQRRILPHLAAGGVVICDRFADSTTTYQGYARAIDPNFIDCLHQFTLSGRWPDVTVLLDIPVAEGFARVLSRGGDAAADRIESESLAFHERVRQGYLDLARKHAERFRVINAAQPADDVFALVMQEVDCALG